MARKTAKRAAESNGAPARRSGRAAAGAKRDGAARARRTAGRDRRATPVPKGMHTVTATLVFKQSVEAIAFYRRAFDARELSLMYAPDGKSVWHAEIRIGDSVVYLSDEGPMSHTVAPRPDHRPTAAIQLYVKDADAWVARAVEAGAHEAMPVQDMFWGDRMGGVIDPFGVYWAIATRKANLTPKQLAKAAEAFARGLAEKVGAEAAAHSHV